MITRQLAFCVGIMFECFGCARIEKCPYHGYEDKQHTRIGGCAMRTHNRKAIVSDDVKINPLKMSKRGIKQ